jgi:hypothetical protein
MHVFTALAPPPTPSITILRLLERAAQPSFLGRHSERYKKKGLSAPDKIAQRGGNAVAAAAWYRTRPEASVSCKTQASEAVPPLQLQRRVTVLSPRQYVQSQCMENLQQAVF